MTHTDKQITDLISEAEICADAERDVLGEEAYVAGLLDSLVAVVKAEHQRAEHHAFQEAGLRDGITTLEAEYVRLRGLYDQDTANILAMDDVAEALLAERDALRAAAQDVIAYLKDDPGIDLSPMTPGGIVVGILSGAINTKDGE